MDQSLTKFFLGIDVGASKSHTLLANELGERVSYDRLAAVLQEAFEQACQMAAIDLTPTTGAGFGVGGYNSSSDRQFQGMVDPTRRTPVVGAVVLGMEQTNLDGYAV